MATAVARALGVMESLKDDTVTNQDALDFIDLFLIAYPAEDGNGVPIPSPTNEEKATHYLRKIWDLHNESIRRGQVRQAASTANSTTDGIFGTRP
jgi:hypothetical protein